MENRAQRPAPEILPARTEIPKITDQRLGRASLTRGNVADSHAPGNNTPETPWQSGTVDHEQGVSKSGNPRLRTTLIQVAWLWVRHQPDSALTTWFKERVKHNGGRLKKPTIVALARKLLVAIWKYVNAGVVIEGAALKTA